MSRIILHADINNFYASVECLYNPEIRSKPVAVCGDPAARHGIVLAKNNLAKAAGIKTGEVIWQTRRKCPGLVIVPPNYPLYIKFSRLARGIYSRYTDQIEPFGLDEAWLDVSGSYELFGSGPGMADEIRRLLKAELGVTASIGVSYNKIFAKLGSDMRKPDATTVITPDNYRQVVWPLPAGDLLYVGPATRRKLAGRGIVSIGDIARADAKYLRLFLGKWGEALWSFANGYDSSPVTRTGDESFIKSVGNSITTHRDLDTSDDVHLVIHMLSESVAARLREHGFKCRTVQIHLRDNTLSYYSYQGKLFSPSFISGELSDKAFELFTANYTWANPVRSLGVRACDLRSAFGGEQLSLFTDEEKRLKLEQLEASVDAIRRRFGNFSVQRAVLMTDDLGKANPKDDHVIHPVAFFDGPILKDC